MIPMKLGRKCIEPKHVQQSLFNYINIPKQLGALFFIAQNSMGLQQDTLTLIMELLEGGELFDRIITLGSGFWGSEMGADMTRVGGSKQ